MRKLGGGIAAVGDQIAVTAEGAIITLGENDILIFTPGTAYDFLDAGEPFAATFTYAVTNSTGLVSAAKVTVTITGVNDGPLLLNDIATILRTTRPPSTFSRPM